MTKLLVEFSKDWADEFDCNGFKIYPNQAAWDRATAKLPELEYFFGTNEGWDEGEIDEDDFKVTEITDEEAAVIEKRLGTTYGIFPLF